MTAAQALQRWLSLTATKLKPLTLQLSKFHKPLFFNSRQAGIIHFTEGTQCYNRPAQPVARDSVNVVHGNICKSDRLLAFPMAKPERVRQSSTEHLLLFMGAYFTLHHLFTV